MATKMENLPLELAHFRNFMTNLPGFYGKCIETIEWMLCVLGCVEVSTAFEQVLANLGGHDLVSQDQGDLYRDGAYSDAKISSVRTSGYGKKYTAPVTGISNKSGNLRVQVYERKQNRFYYFVIPHHAYVDIPPKSNIEIPFECDGTPRRIPKGWKTRENWWRYEVPSLDALSTL